MKVLGTVLVGVVLGSFGCAQILGCLPSLATDENDGRDDGLCGNDGIIVGDLRYYGTVSEDKRIARCSVVQGNLIFHSTDLDSLDGLYPLTEIEGDLSIWFNGNLKSLSGLHRIRSVGGDLKVHGNESLGSLDGLESLATIGQSAVIENNASLVSLNGLESLTEVPELRVEGNSALVSLEGISGLVSVRDLVLSGNSRLSELPVFHEMRFDSLGVTIRESENIIDLGGLEGVTHIRGLSVDGCNEMLGLPGLENLSHVSEVLELKNNESLRDLSALGELLHAGSLKIVSNPSLESTAGLIALASIGVDCLPEDAGSSTTCLEPDVSGGLEISNNLNLVDLEGLNGVLEVGYLIIYRNEAIRSLRGLVGLQYVAGDFMVHDNDALPTCEAEWLRDHVGTDNIDGATIIRGIDDGEECE